MSSARALLARWFPGEARQRGSVAVEVAVLAPAFIGLIVLAAIVGRTAVARNAVDLAAHDAARAASISRTIGEAHANANAAVEEALSGHHVACNEPAVPDFTVNGTDTLQEAFSTDVGDPATITVTVRCTISFIDLGWPGAPPSRLIEATFHSPLDTYRSRS